MNIEKIAFTFIIVLFPVLLNKRLVILFIAAIFNGDLMRMTDHNLNICTVCVLSQIESY